MSCLESVTTHTRPCPQAALFTFCCMSHWSTWPPAKDLQKVVNNLTKIDPYGAAHPGTETSCERNVCKHLLIICYSSARFILQMCILYKYRDSPEFKRISNVNLQENISFSNKKFKGLQAAAQHATCGCQNAVKSHRVISRHHLVQFFCNPDEIFLTRHGCIYSTKNEPILSNRYSK